MKKRLLKPPRNDGEIVFIPDPEGFFGRVTEAHRIGVAHQPYFFHPGVAVKFLFLEAAPRGKKEIVFLDTERVRIGVKVPAGRAPHSSERDHRAYHDAVSPLSAGTGMREEEFVTSDRLLYDYPVPPETSFGEFLGRIEAAFERMSPRGFEECIPNLRRFKESIMMKTGRKLLREILAETFLEYFGLRTPYRFLSDILRGEEFRDLFSRIYSDQNRFRDVFNSALVEYREQYRFRYKQFPFPMLGKDELPFWVVRDGLRVRCFKKDVDAAGAENLVVFPRAVTLTLLLRLYRLDFFIHGVGGWNYEWVQDRIIERFFKETPAPYAAASGTFLLGHLNEREFPYFMFSAHEISRRVRELISHVPERSKT